LEVREELRRKWDDNIKIDLIEIEWYHYFVVVVGLVCLTERETHAGGNTLPAGPPKPDGSKAKGDRPDQKRYPGVPGWTVRA
jgi:hypothetical protein